MQAYSAALVQIIAGTGRDSVNYSEIDVAHGDDFMWSNPLNASQDALDIVRVTSPPMSSTLARKKTALTRHPLHRMPQESSLRTPFM